MGDSAIVETLGLGAFAMSASPAVAQFLGVGGWAEARRYTEEMLEITAGRHPHLLLPTFDELGECPAGLTCGRSSRPPSSPGSTLALPIARRGSGRSAPAWCRRPWRASQALDAFATAYL